MIHVMRVFDISERLVCRLVGLAGSSFRRPLNRDTVDDSDKALRVMVKRRRKRVGVFHVPTIIKAVAPGNEWAIDFQFHSTVAGRPLKILSIVDDYTRQALGGQVEYAITAEDLTDELDVLIIERDTPRALRIGKGGEFISKALRE